MQKLKKILSVIRRKLIALKVYVNVDSYMDSYTKYLQDIGVDFTGIKKKVKFIEPSAYLDGTDYSLIHIGDNVTISREVMILTHDYSINTALCAIGMVIDRHQGEAHFRKDVYIGNDTFVGARASILPGTTIGRNCIIGACSVVKGTIPDNCICIGNPCRIIKNTKDYASFHYEKKDYEIEK